MKRDEIKEKYRKILFRVKIFSIIAVMMSLPKMILALTGGSNILGINKGFWRLSFYGGFIIYIFFVMKQWKCPSCGKFQGGWSRKKCRSCGCELR